MDRPERADPGDALVRAAMDHIEKHSAERFSLKTLSEALYVNGCYLTRRFRSRTGRTPLAYHNAVRCEKAKALLRDPAVSISAVGDAVGFASSSHFSRVFKKVTGLTPSEYRSDPRERETPGEKEEERGKTSMASDMTVRCDDGLINLRVGAIIMRDGRILMVGNERVDYLYSVGGRIRFGETAREAVVREVLEETGVRMEIDRLGFVHENYFHADAPGYVGMLVYEISFFFYMKVPEDFAPVAGSFTEDGSRERLVWVHPDDAVTIYPRFFRTELARPEATVKYFVTDERGK